MPARSFVRHALLAATFFGAAILGYSKESFDAPVSALSQQVHSTRNVDGNKRARIALWNVISNNPDIFGSQSPDNSSASPRSPVNSPWTVPLYALRDIATKAFVHYEKYNVRYELSQQDIAVIQNSLREIKQKYGVAQENKKKRESEGNVRLVKVNADLLAYLYPGANSYLDVLFFCAKIPSPDGKGAAPDFWCK